MSDFCYWISHPSAWGKTPYQAMQERVIRLNQEKIELNYRELLERSRDIMATNGMANQGKVHKLGIYLSVNFNRGTWDCTCDVCINLLKAIIKLRHPNTQIEEDKKVCKICGEAYVEKAGCSKYWHNEAYWDRNKECQTCNHVKELHSGRYGRCVSLRIRKNNIRVFCGCHGFCHES